MQISYEMVSNGSVRHLTVSLEAFSERADRSAILTRDQFTDEQSELIYQESRYTKGTGNRYYQLFSLIKTSSEASQLKNV